MALALAMTGHHWPSAFHGIVPVKLCLSAFERVKSARFYSPFSAAPAGRKGRGWLAKAGLAEVFPFHRFRCEILQILFFRFIPEK